MASSNNKFAYYGENATNRINDATFKPLASQGVAVGDIAQSNEFNTLLRQTTKISQAFAELMALSNQGATISTDLNEATFLQYLKSAIAGNSADGDMLKIVYAAQAQSLNKQGYVDKALNADKLGGVDASQFLNTFTLSNINMPSASWVEDNTVTNMSFRFDILDARITENIVADVYFDNDTIDLKLDNKIMTFNGKLSVYLPQRPTRALKIENILMVSV